MSLQDYITAALEKPFGWGSHDCILFSIGWANIRTGKNLLCKVPPWASQREALRIVAAMGGLEAAFDRGLKRIAVATARDGDIALVGNTALLFCGPHIVGPGLNGLEFIDRTKASCAWSY